MESEINIKPLEERNQKIIDAVLQREKKICPGSIALIGIYGSFATGDVHAKSDLDLLILINDDRGWQLSSCFIQDDLNVGHDIYCTNWDSLKNDAEYNHPNIGKLMDSKIVYCSDEKYRTELESLRNSVREKLNSPFTKEDYEKAESSLKEAQSFFARAVTSTSLPECRKYSGATVIVLENSLAMLNKTYFKKSSKRIYEELSEMKKRPSDLTNLIEAVISANEIEDIKSSLCTLMGKCTATFDEAKKSLECEKQKAADILPGAYEEMFSNWRNKMHLAAQTGNRHLAYTSLVNFTGMAEELYGMTDIAQYDGLEAYNPDDLNETAQKFDLLLDSFLEEYKKAGIKPKRYPDIDAFTADYLG